MRSLTISGYATSALLGIAWAGSVAIALAMRHTHLIMSIVVAEGNPVKGIGTATVHISAYFEPDHVREGHYAPKRSFATRGAHPHFPRRA